MKIVQRKFLAAAALAAPLALAVPTLAAEVFGDWDANSDGIIDAKEWGTGFDENRVYGSWDAKGDGNLTEAEFREGAFGLYDDNDDGRLDGSEFGDYRDDAGDGGFWDV